MNYELINYMWKKFKKIHYSLPAQALVEILIALGLTAIILPALLTGLVTSREGRAQEQSRLQATALLRETEEAVRTVRETNWSTFASNGTYHPVIAGSTWTLVNGEEAINGFSRKVVIRNAERDSNGNIVSTGTIDPSTKKVTMTVSWSSPTPSSLESIYYFHRYLGNAAWTQTTKADFEAGKGINIDTTTNPGSILLGESGNIAGTQITNPGFDTDAAGWTYFDWGQDPGEENVTGNYQSSGGNGGGYIDISVPRSRDNKLGGFWQQGITTTISNPPTVNISFDYKIIDFQGRSNPKQPITFKVYAFLDNSSGTPTIGNQVWNSAEITATGNWTSTGTINVASKLGAAGTYYLKLAIWLETAAAGARVGPYTVGFDNLPSNVGTFESVSFDAGSEVAFNYFTFTITEPAAANVRFQIAVNNDGATWNYFGPDGAGGTFYESPATVPLAKINGRYFRYKATLAGDGPNKPSIDAVSVNYSP